MKMDMFIMRYTGIAKRIHSLIPSSPKAIRGGV